MNRELKRVIKHHKAALEHSGMDFRAIFDITFSLEENILCEGFDGFRTYRNTYGQIRQRIFDAAGRLYQRIGAEHAYVALEMENSPDWLVAFWAILMSGNKPYLVNMRYPASLTEGILKTLNIRYVISAARSSLPGENILIRELKGASDPVPAEAFENEIAFSSSATSMNEVVCFYSGYEVAQQILNFESIIKLNPRMAKHYRGKLKQLAFLPFYHIFGLFAVCFWFTFFGRTLVFLPDYGADTILKTCRRHQVTHIFAVPMLWHTVEKEVFAKAAEGGEKQLAKLQKGIKAMTALQNICPSFGAWAAKRVMGRVTEASFGRSVMFCISGGSYLRDSALELLNGVGYQLHNGFGMSEVAITSVELRKKPKHLNENAIGQPFDSVEYRLENGELFIKGRSLCKRKLVNGQEVVIDGWFATGDLVERRRGEYYILGRKGDMVIGESGENINPDTVEKFFTLPGAAAYSVLGLSAEAGEELSMVVQIPSTLSAEGQLQLREEIYALNELLPMTNRVRKFYFTTDELAPPTAVKVSRTQLKHKIEQGAVVLHPFSELGSSTAEPQSASDLCAAVRAVVARVLGVEEETIDFNAHLFYDLNITSIQYFTILSALGKEFGIGQVNQSESYRYTVREMSEWIEGHR